MTSTTVSALTNGILTKIAARLGFVITTAPDAREAILVDDPVRGAAPHLQCPHCRALDSFAEVDRSTRHNTLVDLDYGLDGRSEDLFVFVSEDDNNYATDHFECQECGGHVTIPQCVEVSWS